MECLLFSDLRIFSLYIPGVPKKVHMFEIKKPLFRDQINQQSLSFVRQVLNLDFDTYFVKIGHKLTEL